MRTRLQYMLAGALIASLPMTVGARTSLTVSVSSPTGSASQEFSKKLIGSMLITPCVSQTEVDAGTSIYGAVGPGPQAGILVDNPYDQLQVKVKGTNSDDDGDGFFDYDLYVILVNLGADGTAADVANARFYVFSRYDQFTTALTPGVEVYLKPTVTDLASAEIYLRSEDFITATFDETLLGGPIAFDTYNLPQGSWLAVAILSDNTEIDFTDPKTWAKWDAKPFLLGMPWSATGKTCERQ